MNLFGELNKYVKDENNFPDGIQNLQNKCFVSYEIDPKNKESYNYNLYPKKNYKNKIPPATVSYLGTEDKNTAMNVWKDMCKLFRGSQAVKRVVVWYVDGSRIIPIVKKKALQKSMIILVFPALPIRRRDKWTLIS